MALKGTALFGGRCGGPAGFAGGCAGGGVVLVVVVVVVIVVVNSSLLWQGMRLLNIKT